MNYSDRLKNEFCQVENFATRQSLRPATLIFKDGEVVSKTIKTIKTIKELERIMSVNGIVTDRESAMKLAYAQTQESGFTIQLGKSELFHPHELPDWILLDF